MSVSQRVSIKQNFHQDSESSVNELINMCLYSAYTCKSMACYFDRDDVGLYGMANFNRWCAREGYQWAKILMDYIVVRGGRVVFDDIKKPEKEDWGTPLESLEYLLSLKQMVNKATLKCHSVADDNQDPHLTDFLETEILQPLVSFIRKIGVLITNLRRAGPNLGEYQFNKDLDCHLKDIMKSSKISTFKGRRNVLQFGLTQQSNISLKELIPVVEQIVSNVNNVQNVQNVPFRMNF